MLLARTRAGVDVDVALGAFPFEERSVQRAFAGRDLDWSDVERVLIRQYGKLDLEQVRAELKPLLDLKGAMDALGKFENIAARVESRLRPSP